MKTAGIIVEYNPMHAGHRRMLDEVRGSLGEDTAVVCAMSGDFVQRGDFALLRRRARAEAAVRSGADLVLELPLPWATASAEGFAAGGVQTLLATGVVTHIAFGSESGDAAALMRVAEVLLSDAFPETLRRELEKGVSFAAARQAAAERLMGPRDAALLREPNNILGVEYCKALLREQSSAEILTVRRTGDGHDGTGLGAEPSSSAIRAALADGRRQEALGAMTPAMAMLYRAEEAAGRAPVTVFTAERAMLAKLRSMGREEFAALDEGSEGLGNRLFAASRESASLSEVLARASAKRYAVSRLRRMILWAYLGMTPSARPASPLYLRPLAMNERGRTLLAKMRTAADLPILTKAADVDRIGDEAAELLRREALAADLYALAYPDIRASQGGTLWREGPFII